MSDLTRRVCLQVAGASAICSLIPDRRRLDRLAHHQRVLVQDGTFLMGTSQAEADALASTYGYHPSWLDGEVPQRTVHLPTFAIDKHPVTNLRFAAFCASTGHPPPPHWVGSFPPPHVLDHPVVYVDHAGAEAFAAWAGMRLPTEEEWEKAARGPLGRVFPWGDVFDPNACQWNADPESPGPGTAPVTLHPSGASPYGVEDMVGNVAEWCSDRPGSHTAVVKGGAWATGEILNLRCAARNMTCAANLQSRLRGFRCVKDVA